MSQVYLSWEDLEELIAQLIFKLNTPYDTILAVARGGIIPAGMVAEALHMRDVQIAAVTFPEVPMQTSEFHWANFVQFPEERLLKDRKVLIIDNLWSQGRTINTILGRVETAGAYPETAVLHWKATSSLYPDKEPDHYVEITERFIHYPWQRIDDSDYRVRLVPKLPTPEPPMSKAPIL